MRSSVQVKQINSQSFLSFKKVRQMESSLYGKYFLYSKNGFKYIGKHLSKDYQLVSYRNTVYPVLKYKGKEDCIYLFPLHGQQLLNFMSKSNIDGEIKRWVQKNVTLENCLWEIVRFVSNLIQKKKLTQILVECLRIHNGQLQYCYDSWMNQSHTIVLNNQNQLENYYFSQQDLDRLRQIIDFPQSDNRQEFQVSIKSLYFRLFMMVLHLGTMNLKQRNYQYGYYQIHKQHLKIRLDYFCSRYNSKNLGTLTKMIIEEQNYDVNQLSKICLPETLEQKHNQTVNSNSFKSICMTKSRRKETENDYQTRSPIKISQIGKLNMSYISNISHNSVEEDNRFFLEKSIITNNKISQLRVREQNMQDATMKSSLFNKSKHNISFESQQNAGKIQVKKTYEPNKSKVYKVCNSVSKKQVFNLRSILNEKSDIPQSGTKVLKYFNLQQFVPENKYQEHIIKVLQKIHVKNNWIKQFYENGSIYFGQMMQNKKSGKGMYLFNSNDFYFGDWAVNFMQGYGSYIFASGQIYEGELKKGFKQGHGKCIYQDGRQYEGSWCNNSKIGLGKVSFPNQVVFIGLFKPQAKETQGLFIGPLDQNSKPLWQNKGILQYYHWQKNLILNDKNEQIERKAKLMTIASQNYGQFRDEDGSFYGGQIKDGMKQGFGILQNQKQKYDGHWLNGNKHGQGTLYVKNMFSLKGKWKDNIMVEYFYDENEDI